jgi:asparagine synthase (glutamine-hydrolysing)
MYAQIQDSELTALFDTPEVKQISTAEYVHDLYVGNIQFEDDVEALSYMDVINYIGNHHVHRVDQFTMAHSVEGRFPFLDHNLVEAAYKIPSQYKLKGKLQKYVLREVAKNYISPTCLSMKKKGFGLPLRQWMLGPLKGMVSDKLARLRQRPDISANVVRKWEEDYKNGIRSPQKIWHMVAMELWFERFIDGERIH